MTVLLANGFEEAFLGVGVQFNNEVAVYDYNQCLTILVQRDGMTIEEAEEWMSFNVTGAFVGLNTPVFVRRCTIDQYQQEVEDEG